MSKCTHKVAADHVVSRDPAGRRVWKCSMCNRTGTWGPTWMAYGSVECRHCERAVVDDVACSQRCAKALHPHAKVIA